ncbi:MAG: urease accessory protein ureD [Proteobacteria bacterium SG_bin9]|nr:MAG: urease accessory protein ureD [Proteobacteria bacterium SG_bin9]
MGRVAASQSAVFAANRAAGGVTFDVAADAAGVTRLRDIHEHGSLRLRFPNPDGKGLSGVLINTAGGVAGGDVFGVDVTAGVGASVTVTTAAAEKIYRSHGPDARINVTLNAGDGACLAWVPQETILFNHARAARSFEIDLAETATLLLCEIVVFGRTAMDETMTDGRLVDRWRMRRGGKLVFAETVRLDGNIAAQLSKSAIAKGGVAIGTVLIAPGDEALAARIRELEPSFGCEVGVSVWNGFAMVRFCAQDAARLRADMIAVLAQANVVPLPRIWVQ